MPGGFGIHGQLVHLVAQRDPGGEPRIEVRAVDRAGARDRLADVGSAVGGGSKQPQQLAVE